MKKYIIGMTIASAVFMAACGSEDTSSSSEAEKGTETEEVAAEETSASTEETTEEVAEETEEEPAEEETSEDVMEDEDLRAENVYTDKELNITGTTGPINYSIDGIQFKKITLKSDYAAEAFGGAVGDVVEGFTIEFTGENTSESDVSFYLGQATAITNTKEQLEPDFLLSEHIEGDYLGQVQHGGFVFYPLQNSSVDDLESIEVRVDAPFDAETYDDIGEDVVQTITIER